MSVTRIKICGLTNLADARLAATAGADLLGFIFYEPSPRYVPPTTVSRIVAALKEELAAPPQFVGVFVNTLLAEVEDTLAGCDLDLAQLHGDEGADAIRHFQGRAYKAANPRSLAEATTLAGQFLVGGAPFLLLDAYHPHLRGGTGHTADWAMAAQIAQAHPILLAGGLTADNVAQAIQAVRPWGVDVSSGIEASKGKKDRHKLQAFIKTVQQSNQPTNNQ